MSDCDCNPPPKWWTLTFNGHAFRCVWNALSHEWQSHEAFESDDTVSFSWGDLTLRLSAREAAEAGFPVDSGGPSCEYRTDFGCDLPRGLSPGEP